MRERGLKQGFPRGRLGRHDVVPRAGTWIETDERKAFTMGNWVVPRAGTWIETYDTEYVYQRDGGRSPCGNVD